MSAPTIQNTLGAAFLGNLAAAVLYGVTCVQIFMYFQKFSRDPLPLRITVIFLWMCDTIHLVLITHGIYFYAVTNFSNPAALQYPTLTIMVHIVITSISDLTVRFVFGYRLWKFSNGNILLAVTIAVTSLMVFGFSISFTALGIVYKTFANLSNIAYLLYVALGSAVVADTLIAVSLCITLARRRTGFSRTDSIVNTLMIYTINTGLITSIVAAMCFILYAVLPHSNSYIVLAVFFSMSKLYFNALLATLNARANLREQWIERAWAIPLPAVAESTSDSGSNQKPVPPHIDIKKPGSLNELSEGYIV